MSVTETPSGGAGAVYRELDLRRVQLQIGVEVQEVGELRGFRQHALDGRAELVVGRRLDDVLDGRRGELPPE